MIRVRVTAVVFEAGEIFVKLPRTAFLTTALAAGAALGLAPVSPTALVAATPHAPASGGKVVGDLVYVTNHNQVHMVKVHANGSATGDTRIGPVTAATPGHTIQVQQLVGSGDGKWVAWLEASVKHTSAGYIENNSTVVLRNQVTGELTPLAGKATFPLGFAEDTLVALHEGVHNKIERVKLSPQPHYVATHESESASALTTYKHGVVESNIPHSASTEIREQLRLTNFKGKHRVLHTYAMGANDTRNLDEGFSSGDQRRLAVELGDHTDFGGVGPSSDVDEYHLGGAAHLTHLGHYGTASAGWRVQSISFAGSKDSVWTAWTSALTDTTVKAVVTRYSGGKWKLVRNHAVAVSGSESGWVVVQPGKYVPIQNDVAPQYQTKATGDALLMRPGHGQHTISGVKGTIFVWSRS